MAPSCRHGRPVLTARGGVFARISVPEWLMRWRRWRYLRRGVARLENRSPLINWRCSVSLASGPAISPGASLRVGAKRGDIIAVVNTVVVKLLSHAVGPPSTHARACAGHYLCRRGDGRTGASRSAHGMRQRGLEWRMMISLYRRSGETVYGNQLCPFNDSVSKLDNAFEIIDSPANPEIHYAVFNLAPTGRTKHRGCEGVW